MSSMPNGGRPPRPDDIQVMTMIVSKDHEFLVVVPPSVGHMPVPGEDERVTARVFYLSPPRANQQLVIGPVATRVWGTD